MPDKPIHVLELGSGVASSYAAKLLGDTGAEVIKVESPDGDFVRQRGPFPNGQSEQASGGLFLAINQNKRSICLDFASSGGLDDLANLLVWADIVVHGLSRKQAIELDLDPASVDKNHPSLVVLSLTPFGITGPYADFQATELILSNAGGWANLCPATHTDPDLPPLKVFGDQCALMSAVAGATAALAFMQDRSSSQVGEYIDFSIQEYVASVLEVAVPAYSYKGEVPARFHQRSLIPWRIFHAKDAPVFIVCVEQDQWERLVEFMGHPDWAELELFADQPGRAENQDMVHALVQEFVGEWQALDLYHAAQKHRFCVAPVLDLAQLASNEHLRERGFFSEIDGIEYLSSAVLTTGGRARVSRVAPKLGDHTDEILADLFTREAPEALEVLEAPNIGAEKTLPLAGVRVLDMTWAWAGPFCSMNLAHLGAEVIRVESDVRPDLYRRLPVHPTDMEEGLNRSGMFNQWNQGKTSVAVDLSKPAGIELVKQLIAKSDVVVQNFATGVMDRMGLGYDTLKAIKADIILASISGYGQTGPYREYMGYGPAIPPLTGLAAATGYLGGEAEEIGISMPDPTAGITAAYAVVVALVKRDQTGQGDHLDITLWEATAVLNVEAWMQYQLTGTQPQRRGNRSTYMAPHGVFRCKGEDNWVAIACADDAQWRELATSIDADLAADKRFDTLANRQANEDELELIITAWTTDEDRWDITRSLQAKGIAAFPTFSCADVVEDPHLNVRQFIERLHHPEVGERAHTGIPWRLSHRANGVQRPAPCLGADTDRHLMEILGYSEDQLAVLRQDQVIA
jgi:crotonobetainyl-CoA:carnitine CoA-transferase CaiB-like acyl-CoA transferase